MTTFQPRKLTFFAAATFLSWTSLVNAESIIKVESMAFETNEDEFQIFGSDDSGVRQIRSHTAIANVILDNEDIFDMPSISFSGIDGTKSDFKKITASYSSENDGTNADETVWHGALMGGGVGFATFIRGPDGAMSGSFATEDTAYVLSTMPDGTTQVKSTLFKDFPPEDDDDDHEDLVEADWLPSELTQQMPDDDVTDVNSGKSLRGTAVHEASNNTDLLDIMEAEAYTGDQGRSLQQSTVVNILVIITNRAMCEAAGLSHGCSLTAQNRATIERNLKVAEAQTSNALKVTGAGARVRIADFVYTSFDGDADSASLNTIKNSRNVAKWRKSARADLVALITGGKKCGIGQRPGPYSATNYRCLGGYTFTHEVGHNIGCYHNRGNSKAKHSYAHGWQSPGKFRTVMSYDCSNSCTRIPYFSNTKYVYKGRAMGDSKNNNARQIRNNVAKVAGWM